MTLYATRTQLADHSLKSEILALIPLATQNSALASASAIASSYLGSRYTLPLVAWGSDVVQAVCDIAALICMRREGFRPGSPGVDDNLISADATARAWLLAVSRGQAAADVTAATPAPTLAARAEGAELRGW